MVECIREYRLNPHFESCRELKRIGKNESTFPDIRCSFQPGIVIADSIYDYGIFDEISAGFFKVPAGSSWYQK